MKAGTSGKDPSPPPVTSSPPASPTAASAHFHPTCPSGDGPCDLVVNLLDVSNSEASVAIVGGKNASLGEMLQNLSRRGIRVPPGFATTAFAYRRFLDRAGLGPVLARVVPPDLDPADLAALCTAGKMAREDILRAELPPELQTSIVAAYQDLCADAHQDTRHWSVEHEPSRPSI